ncbi:AAA family ATPase [Pseudomonas taiwanensis]|uniref:AAA family ATPase n=1 Tax=Pseudomonas taiwanensis TaxID=470150 RepID=UPI0028DDD157|nr:AAA family ATPase [Pseudomonas taiwanensis]MDT8925532.1 AAA family ATPase [Pseudomonas taiwanensis]
MTTPADQVIDAVPLQHRAGQVLQPAANPSTAASDADWLVSLMNAKQETWSGVCQALDVPCGFEITTEHIRDSVHDFNPEMLTNAVKIFGLSPATCETLLLATKLSGPKCSVGGFFRDMIPVARCWEAAPFGVEKDWSYDDAHYQALNKVLFEKPLEVSDYWIGQFEEHTQHFFDIKEFSEQAKKIGATSQSLVIFIRAWILRLCQQQYGPLQQVENPGFFTALSNAITSEAPNDNLCPGEIAELLVKQYGASAMESPFCFYLIPILKSPVASFLAKDVFLSAIIEKNRCDGVLALSQSIWMRHMLEMAPPRLIVEAALQHKDWEIPGLQDYLEKGRDSGWQQGESARRVHYKVMNLPVKKERFSDVKSKPIQTYVKLCPPSILADLEVLDRRFPNFHEVTAYVRKKLLFAIKLSKPFHTPPIVLKGPSGVGKTFYLQNLKEVLALPALTLHSAQITCGSALAGLQSTWSTGQPGAMSTHLASSQIANSLVLFDELSQLKSAISTNGLSSHSVLLQALDKNESKTFRDAYTLEEIDLSKMSWFFTANNLNNLDSFLLTRLTIFNIEPIKAYADRAVIDDLMQQITVDLELPEGMLQPLDDLCCRQILDHLNHGGNLRKLRLLLEDAVTEMFEHPGTTASSEVSISSAWLRKHL